MGNRLRASLSKINFLLNRNPRVTKLGNTDVSLYIPQPHHAVFILSADFELAWAWRYTNGVKKQKEDAVRSARSTRKNIPGILRLCDSYNIPITWATVGHLFLEKCDRDGGVPHPKLKRIPYHKNRYWRFDKGEWYDDDPCTNWQIDPEWYAPDLIRLIVDHRANHEIACHTFSHIDCRDDVCTPSVLEDEVAECRRYAQDYGIEMVSFVHPGHTIGNIATIKRLGFTSYRTDYHNVLGFPIRHPTGLWELQTSAEIYYRKGWSVDYHTHRLCSIIDRGVRHRRLIYFWFHPSFPEFVVDMILEPMFDHIAKLRDDGKLLVANTKDYVAYLNGTHREVHHE